MAQNQGSVTGGCDGVTMAIFDRQLEQQLERLREDLRHGRFEPYPVRRVYIQKTTGKLRPLGILTIRDRIVQETVRMVLEPIFEADFSPNSYGFRPNRRTMDAIKAITLYTTNATKYFWAIEGDIASCFDSIHHKKLLKLVQRRVKDQRLLALIQKFLRAGVMEGKLFKDTRYGVPQGGILSPLLSNIYLHELDRYMERYTGLSPWQKRKRRQQGKGNFTLSRYADDFVILTNGAKADAEAMRQEVADFLRDELKLTLSLEKTKVTHLNDGFAFLGFWLQRKVGHRGNRVTKVLIPPEAIRRFRGKILESTRGKTNDSVYTKILALDRIVGGWCRYYQYTTRASTVFNTLGHVVFKRMTLWLCAKYAISAPEAMRRFRHGNTLGTKRRTLRLPSDYRTQVYREPIRKPNPYTGRGPVGLRRETLFNVESMWTGFEAIKGQADRRD